MNTFIAYVLKLISIVIFLSLLQSCSIQKQLNRDLKDSKVLQLGFTGFALYDVDSQKMIYTYNADKYFIPASNTKLFTFYTGLKILGDSVPALQYRISGDSLIFRGTGDPSLLYKNLPESKVLNFLEESKQNLYYQPHSITTSGFGPGWAWDDYNDYYSAERSEFPIYGNVVSISESYLENTPRTYPSYFQKILIKSNEDHSSSKVKRVLEKNELVYTDNWKPSKNEQIIPFKTTPQLFAQLLSDTLHKKVEVLNITNSNQKIDRILYSLPSDSIYYKMLQDSDNFIAEQILLMASLKISDTLAPEKAIDFMKRNYLKDLPETKWIDGSGLSRYNLFSPRSIVLLLKKIRKEVPQERLLKMLPAGGKSGTLKDYFVNEPAYIFAKTGTLSNNQALSGYIKAKSGKILIFSFMENNYLRPASEIRKQLEPIFKNIYEKY
ncbi:D-alanyl-D-alanine carboxypeptidase / D-alanyl-D-alanine-endopeptidase (penicillin-binding protein 4) [Gillisia sp. Hel1_33_143]|uniref:D-alanyl-D-alanine carboxypeptidase/D-alanyl-D-alanine endopeptidase n=1 Tax=Gillisia sp. Hel1_33_143 TaxID=1336796 RepID=UPI00087C8BFD|nr:D-alanyl-D-alanine carboxypeptidase/D-alanyl-D-alanine-endopeptidase [Gillisia sp. Hel1_33_143]SDS08476.1 D-alanyl-D-alanine carboxypeptidase / D-alanyl-D-alanine-endopeptidase (penicillin-binding protein 4) [Gillisia sp. Hel1_33_143]